MDPKFNEQNTQQSFIISIVVMILLLAGLATFYPLLTDTPGDIHVEYLIFGAIAAFMIFLLGSRCIQDNCPSCNKRIPADSNLCPYCGYKIK